MIPDQSSALLTSSEQCPLHCWPTCFLEGNTPLVFRLLGSTSYFKLCPQNQFTCESLCNCIGTLVCSIECPFQAQHIPQSLKRQDHKELYRTSNEEERGIVEELEFKTFTIKFKHFEIWCTVPKGVWMKPSSASSISLAMGLSGQSLRTRHIGIWCSTEAVYSPVISKASSQHFSRSSLLTNSYPKTDQTSSSEIFLSSDWPKHFIFNCSQHESMPFPFL